MIARYDLARWIPSFDFFTWLVIVAASGAKGITVDTRKMKAYKWPPDVCMRRVETILLPGPALVGLPCRIGEDGVDPNVNPDLESLVRHCRAGKPIATLRSVLPPGDVRYTVTLRKTQRSPQRNSNMPAWRAFAKRIGARVIEDHDTLAIGLHERLALYAGAEMNFFVVSGPSHLCALAGLPCMIFDAGKSMETWKRNTVARGERLPWLKPGQTVIWEPDDRDVIERHFAAWERTHA